MNLKNIMLNERSQTPKTTYCMISFVWHSREDNIIVIKSRSVVSWGEKWGKETDCKRAWETFWCDGNDLYLYCGGGYRTVYTCQNSSHCTLKICELYYMQIIS